MGVRRRLADHSRIITGGCFEDDYREQVEKESETAMDSMGIGDYYRELREKRPRPVPTVSRPRNAVNTGLRRLSVVRVEHPAEP